MYGSVSQSNLSIMQIGEKSINQSDRFQILDPKLPGAILLGILVLAHFCHVAAFACSLTKRLIKNPFCWLIATNSLADALGTIYLAWFAIAILVQAPLMPKEVGFLGYFTFGTSVECDLIFAVNRFLAAYKPLLYERLFSAKRTKCYIGLLVLVGFVACIPHTTPGCQFHSDFRRLRMLVTERTACGEFLRNGTMHTAAGLECVAILLNIASFLKLNLRRTIGSTRIRLPPKTNRNRRWAEIRFLAMAFIAALAKLFTVLSLAHFAEVAGARTVAPWGQEPWSLQGSISGVQGTTLTTLNQDPSWEDQGLTPVTPDQGPYWQDQTSTLTPSIGQSPGTMEQGPTWIVFVFSSLVPALASLVGGISFLLLNTLVSSTLFGVVLQVFNRSTAPEGEQQDATTMRRLKQQTEKPEVTTGLLAEATVTVTPYL